MKTHGSRSPDKKELAQIKVYADMGLSSHAIEKKTGRSKHTIRKYLEMGACDDPEVQQMVAIIKSEELTDLRLIGYKARINLHAQLEGGKMRPIENIAAMDRSFQQVRLLEGESTENVSVSAKIHELSNDLKLIDQVIKKRREEQGVEGVSRDVP